jgi:hypothetical protein
LFAGAAFGNDNKTHSPSIPCPHLPPPSQPSGAEITTCPHLFAEAAFGNDDETNCSGLPTTCILSRHSGKAELSMLRESELVKNITYTKTNPLMMARKSIPKQLFVVSERSSVPFCGAG